MSSAHHESLPSSQASQAGRPGTNCRFLLAQERPSPSSGEQTPHCTHSQGPCPPGSFSQESQKSLDAEPFLDALIRGSGSPFTLPQVSDSPRSDPSGTAGSLRPPSTVGGTGRPEADGHQPRVKWIPLPLTVSWFQLLACLNRALAVSQFHGDSILTKALTWLRVYAKHWG